MFWREERLCLDGGLNENKRRLIHLIPLNTLNCVTDNSAVNTFLTHAVMRKTPADRIYINAYAAHSRYAYQFMHTLLVL